jgi:hypothetical protein
MSADMDIENNGTIPYFLTPQPISAAPDVEGDAFIIYDPLKAKSREQRIVFSGSEKKAMR